MGFEGKVAMGRYHRAACSPSQSRVATLYLIVHELLVFFGGPVAVNFWSVYVLHTAQPPKDRPQQGNMTLNCKAMRRIPCACPRQNCGPSACLGWSLVKGGHLGPSTWTPANWNGA